MTRSSSSSTPTPADTPVPSTEPTTLPQVGDTVLVLIEPGMLRPLLVAEVDSTGRVSGLLACVDDDHECTAFRGWESGDGAEITGRPHRHTPWAYGHRLHPGQDIGQWRHR